MGSQSSKSTTQTWTNDKPVQFSSSLIDSLQTSPETDSTRAKALELQIQSRVQSELERLQSLASKEYADIQAKVSAEDETRDTEHSPSDRLRDLGREVVQGEIHQLKSKLEKSKRVRELDEGVAKAKSDVIACLRENDRRPLDCWATVQKFKEEVARLEESWIQKVVT